MTIFLMSVSACLPPTTSYVIDLQFVHAKSKRYLKVSIMLIIGEQSSRYPFALFHGLYPSWSFECARDGKHRRNY